MGTAENDLHQGRREAALPNLEALAGLAQMERGEPPLATQMIRVAVANPGLAVTCDWGIAAELILEADGANRHGLRLRDA
jgi:hypothetical protein